MVPLIVFLILLCFSQPVHGGCVSSFFASCHDPTPHDAVEMESSMPISMDARWTFFQQAVLEKNELEIKHWIRQKSPNPSDDSSLLHRCVSMNNAEFLRAYLMFLTSSELNQCTVEGHTPLMLALVARHDAVIELLLKQDMLDVHAVDKDGWSTLMYAALRASPERFKQFLAYPTSKPLDINHQSRSGHFALKVLVKAATVTNEKLNLFLEYAAGRLEIPNVSSMLEMMRQTSGKFVTIWRHLSPAAQIRLTQGRDKLHRPLLCSYFNYDAAILEEWLKVPGIDINVRCPTSTTPLMLMAMFGDWPEAKLLLSQANIQVNLQDKNGETALMFATYCRGIGYKEIVEALLQRSDIDATLVDKKRRTGMDLAMSSKLPALIELYQNHLLDSYATWVEKSLACIKFPMDLLIYIATWYVKMHVPNSSEVDQRPMAEWLVKQSCKNQ